MFSELWFSDRDHEMCHICLKLVSGFRCNSIHVFCLARIQPLSMCLRSAMLHNVVARYAVSIYHCHIVHEQFTAVYLDRCLKGAQHQ